MPSYVVGRDWPDHFYATNARWPEPAQWTYRHASRTSAFRVSVEEAKRAQELEEQALARHEARKLKKQLFAAIIQRDLATVRQLVRRTPLLLERHTPAGATPLGLAAAVGDSPIVDFLLAEGGDVCEGDRVGATPLIAAAARGHTQVCLQLLRSKQGANAGRLHLLRQATRRAGEAAVHAAARGGHLDTLRALLEAAAAAVADKGQEEGKEEEQEEAAGMVGLVDAEGRDCLMMAAANDHTQVMNYLIREHRLSPTRADKLGRTALMYAAAGGAVQAVQLLLSLLASADMRGSAAAAAAGRGAGGTSPHGVPTTPATATATAARAVAAAANPPPGSTGIPSTPSSSSPAQPPSAALPPSSTQPHSQPASVEPPPDTRTDGAPGAGGAGGGGAAAPPPAQQQQQQEQQQQRVPGDPLHARDGRGYTALHHACLGGSVEVIELLTQAGLSLSPAEQPLSLELLRLACRAGHAGVVGWLMKQGVGIPEAASEGPLNPMFAAVAGGSAAVVDVILAQGGRIDPRDSRGRTPLAVAAACGSTRLCAHLVSAGADLTAADLHGRVPRCAAYRANHRETAEVLAHLARVRLVRGDDEMSREEEE
ncbi:hypothetical protein Agub_g11959 [Astrephomene gubernaculifera]|uniref:Uncharacterized protein n=1 Tax=Astrephomene gubernaculifera TaxID=47775 RepID=A0AAD3DXS9_9CHLO|nr:hypothetical protein Agub_g11959 [Astrephomene gubernaculifera]